MPVQMPEQEREFAISRIETENGIFRADGVATIVGINVVELNYRELWLTYQRGADAVTVAQAKQKAHWVAR